MKKLLFAVTALVFSTGAFAQAKSDDIAKITAETIDLGKVKQSEPAKATFVVTNTGIKDLLIEQANPTCGCTIGDYTKTPIAPGKTGTITATYNAAGVGAFTKTMNVKFAGADDMKSITIKGEVLTPDDYAKLKGGAGVKTSTAVATPVGTVKTATTVKAGASVKKAKKTKA